MKILYEIDRLGDLLFFFFSSFRSPRSCATTDAGHNIAQVDRQFIESPPRHRGIGPVQNAAMVVTPELGYSCRSACLSETGSLSPPSERDRDGEGKGKRVKRKGDEIVEWIRCLSDCTQSATTPPLRGVVIVRGQGSTSSIVSGAEDRSVGSEDLLRRASCSPIFSAVSSTVVWLRGKREREIRNNIGERSSAGPLAAARLHHPHLLDVNWNSQ